MKQRIGIIFGGFSREREISFAGGRTVYDNLNKSLFEAVPLFVDSFGNFIELDWEYIYKGSIRDFYPPASSLPPSPGFFQIYAESLGELSPEEQEALFRGMGKAVPASRLAEKIDFAFLCLHGPYGEDGRIQGLLEYHGIPYSGSGIFSSSIGINKAIQKKLMRQLGFDGPDFLTINRKDWTGGNQKEILKEIESRISFPCVAKPAHQGSSIGVSVMQSGGELTTGIDRAFFIRKISSDEWNKTPADKRNSLIRSMTDIREGLGLPLTLITDKASEEVYHPDTLLEKLTAAFESGVGFVTLTARDAESEVVVEQFIHGKEFSCIVVIKEDGKPVALPPTGIRKGKELFDYRSKYLPGLSRKITPIELPYDQIQKIRSECERLYTALGFNVYARIDGFVTDDGRVFLNDPNTTSGMMPSSFFFHQAAEIGLNPSQFLTYIIRTSLSERMSDMYGEQRVPMLLKDLDRNILSLKQEQKKKIRVAVIMGGYSTERHISMESGRNVYEKLASSEKYLPVPVFLTGSDKNFRLFQIPISLMLKDHADDIRDNALDYHQHEVVREIMMLCEDITTKYTSTQNVLQPKEILLSELHDLADVAFIALHGRPGEDGQLQSKLEELGIPYNGSGVDSSKVTINKFETNEILLHNGFHVARHRVIEKDAWMKDKKKLLSDFPAQFGYPLIAKPVDDGCSSAVKKIRNEEELIAFADAIFRDTEDLTQEESAFLQLKPREEFPRKQQLLVEELIGPKGAKHFLEITGGMLTRVDDSGARKYEVFEASEALAGGDVLSLEEKFLAGEGQNITPARYSMDPDLRQKISDKVKEDFLRAAQLLNIEGYARIDAFVRVYDDRIETVFIEVNSLPGMTPATCIFHQAAIAGYKPYDFIDRILSYGMQRMQKTVDTH